jgi:hypothetical protein
MNLTLVIDEDDAETCRIALKSSLGRLSDERNGGLHALCKEGYDAYVAALDAAIEATGGRDAQRQRRGEDTT